MEVSEAQDFLAIKKSWPQGRMRTMRKQICAGSPYDVELFQEYRHHQALILESLRPILAEIAANFGLGWARRTTEVAPGSGMYRYSDRVKTVSTTVDKIRRLQKTNLNRIQDIAGARIDFDGSLDDQNSLAADILQELEKIGDTSCRVVDRRGGEKAGYRAIHIYALFPAGRAEIQLRTSLQAQWANAYEAAADLWGRQIRYDGWESHLDAEEHGIVYDLQQFSQEIKNVEMLLGVDRGEEFEDPLQRLQRLYFDRLAVIRSELIRKRKEDSGQ